jgi:hypothetical protein
MSELDFVRHGRLLVPADAVTVELDPEAAQLRSQLAAARDLQAVQAEDVLARRAAIVGHALAMDDVDDQESAAKRQRRERVRDEAEAEALAALYRRAARSGARARIKSQILGSAEMRALRIAKVRQVALLAGLPVLAAFAAWSTTGAQAGVARLLHLDEKSAAWTASWVVEPALITIVALIIVGRAVLRSSGGKTDWKATVAEWTALGLSLGLNIFGGWFGGWAGLSTALPHAIGPLGCAGTAFLIGLFDGYVTAARPWDDAKSLADLGLLPPAAVPAAGLVPAGRPVPVTAVPGSPVPARRTGTGPGRAVSAAGTGRRALAARTAPGTGGTTTVAGSIKSLARQHWEAEVAAGRTPTGTDLMQACGRERDDTGVFRRYAREWAGELAGEATDAAVS